MPVDPNALATWANLITVSRIALSPVMFLVIPDHNRGSWLAFGLWFVLCVTDGIDGYLARRHGTTASGAFLDPLADKVLVLGAMFTLVTTDMFWIVPVAIIAGREFVISVYRTFVASKGVSIPASQMAKWKTLFQQLAVGFALWPWFAVDAKWVWVSLLWGAVGLAVVSGAQYLWYSRVTEKALAEQTAVSTGVRCDVLAVGTELLLGQIVDTNSAWMGEQLAVHGFDSLVQVKVGDNVGRITTIAAPDARRRRRRHHVRWTRPDPRRPHPRGHRGGDGRRARARRHRRRDDPRAVREPGPPDVREQPPPGDGAGRRDHHPPDAGHGARPDLPGRDRRCREGRVRGARRAARDARHVHPRHHPGAAAPVRCSGS